MKMPQRRGAFHCCATGNDTTKRIEYTMKVTTRRVRLQRPCPLLLVAVDCESEEWKIHFRICDQLFRMIHCDHLHRYAYSCVCGRSFEGNASHELTPLCACVCACNSASQLKSFWSAVNRVAFVSFILWNRSPQSQRSIQYGLSFYGFSSTSPVLPFGSILYYAATTTGKEIFYLKHGVIGAALA